MPPIVNTGSSLSPPPPPAAATTVVAPVPATTPKSSTSSAGGVVGWLSGWGGSAASQPATTATTPTTIKTSHSSNSSNVNAPHSATANGVAAYPPCPSPPALPAPTTTTAATTTTSTWFSSMAESLFYPSTSSGGGGNVIGDGGGDGDTPTSPSALADITHTMEALELLFANTTSGNDNDTTSATTTAATTANSTTTSSTANFISILDDHFYTVTNAEPMTACAAVLPPSSSATVSASTTTTTHGSTTTATSAVSSASINAANVALYPPAIPTPHGAPLAVQPAPSSHGTHSATITTTATTATTAFAVTAAHYWHHYLRVHECELLKLHLYDPQCACALLLRPRDWYCKPPPPLMVQQQPPQAPLDATEWLAQWISMGSQLQAAYMQREQARRSQQPQQTPSPSPSPHSSAGTILAALSSSSALSHAATAAGGSRIPPSATTTVTHLRASTVSPAPPPAPAAQSMSGSLTPPLTPSSNTTPGSVDTPLQLPSALPILPGHILVSNFQLIFVPITTILRYHAYIGHQQQQQQHQHPQLLQSISPFSCPCMLPYISVPLLSIASNTVSCIGDGKLYGVLECVCKDFRTIRLLVPLKRTTTVDTTAAAVATAATANGASASATSCSGSSANATASSAALAATTNSTTGAIAATTTPSEPLHCLHHLIQHYSVLKKEEQMFDKIFAFQFLTHHLCAPYHSHSHALLPPSHLPPASSSSTTITTTPLLSSPGVGAASRQLSQQTRVLAPPLLSPRADAAVTSALDHTGAVGVTPLLGWQLYSAAHEYGRMGAIQLGTGVTSGFRLVNTLNCYHQFSSTYPSSFLVPAAVSDADLNKIATFRAKRRIPVVAYVHRLSGGTVHANSVDESSTAATPLLSSALIRCAQPLVGLMGGRCDADEQFMRAVCAACASSALLIVDARPFTNASFNNFSSGGYESVDNYKGGCIRSCAITFLSIANIHSIRTTYDTVASLCAQLSDEHQAMEMLPANVYTVSPPTLSIGSSVSLPLAHTSLYGTALAPPLLCNVAATFKHVASAAPTVVVSPSAAAATATTTPKSAGDVTSSLPTHSTTAMMVATAVAAAASPPTNSAISRFQSKLFESGYFTHIENILHGCKVMVQALQAGVCVLSHCSDGWDRTSQLCALTMVCCDGYYRTLRGLCALIESTFLSMGHQFFTRGNHGALQAHTRSGEDAPVFTQFLDCLYQLLCAFPAHFEYTPELLVYLHASLYNGLHGTFLSNSAHATITNTLHARTASVWSTIAAQRQRFTNPLYGMQLPNHAHKMAPRCDYHPYDAAVASSSSPPPSTASSSSATASTFTLSTLFGPLTFLNADVLPVHAISSLHFFAGLYLQYDHTWGGLLAHQWHPFHALCPVATSVFLPHATHTTREHEEGHCAPKLSTADASLTAALTSNTLDTSSGIKNVCETLDQSPSPPFSPPPPSTYCSTHSSLAYQLHARLCDAELRAERAEAAHREREVRGCLRELLHAVEAAHYGAELARVRAEHEALQERMHTITRNGLQREHQWEQRYWEAHKREQEQAQQHQRALGYESKLHHARCTPPLSGSSSATSAAGAVGGVPANAATDLSMLKASSIHDNYIDNYIPASSPRPAYANALQRYPYGRSSSSSSFSSCSSVSGSPHGSPPPHHSVPHQQLHQQQAAFAASLLGGAYADAEKAFGEQHSPLNSPSHTPFEVDAELSAFIKGGRHRSHSSGSSGSGGGGDVSDPFVSHLSATHSAAAAPPLVPPSPPPPPPALSEADHEWVLDTAGGRCSEPGCQRVLVSSVLKYSPFSVVLPTVVAAAAASSASCTSRHHCRGCGYTFCDYHVAYAYFAQQRCEYACGACRAKYQLRMRDDADGNQSHAKHVAQPHHTRGVGGAAAGTTAAAAATAASSSVSSKSTLSSLGVSYFATSALTDGWRKMTAVGSKFAHGVMDYYALQAAANTATSTTSEDSGANATPLSSTQPLHSTPSRTTHTPLAAHDPTHTLSTTYAHSPHTGLQHDHHHPTHYHQQQQRGHLLTPSQLHNRHVATAVLSSPLYALTNSDTTASTTTNTNFSTATSNHNHSNHPTTGVHRARLPPASPFPPPPSPPSPPPVCEPPSPRLVCVETNPGPGCYCMVCTLTVVGDDASTAASTRGERGRCHWQPCPFNRMRRRIRAQTLISIQGQADGNSDSDSDSESSNGAGG